MSCLIFLFRCANDLDPTFDGDAQAAVLQGFVHGDLPPPGRHIHGDGDIRVPL